MNDKNWLWLAIIILLIVIGFGRKAHNQPNQGWVPQNRSVPERLTCYEDYIRKARETGKPVVVLFTSKTCVHCERMKRETLPNVGVQQAMGKYIFYVVDVNKEPHVAAKLKVTNLPTAIIVDGNECVQKYNVGYMTADNFKRWLEEPVAPPSQAYPPKNQPPSQGQRHQMVPG